MSVAGGGRFVPLGVFVVLAGVLLAGFFLDDPHRLPSELVGRELPAFELEDVLAAGVTVGRDDVVGEPCLINVWATWCPTCVVEHAYLNRLAREHGVSIIGINYNDDTAKARDWLDRYGNPYRRVIADTDGRLGIDLGVYGAPETFVMDHEGRIRYRHVGVVDERVWRDVLSPLLDKYRMVAGRDGAS